MRIDFPATVKLIKHLRKHITANADNKGIVKGLRGLIQQRLDDLATQLSKASATPVKIKMGRLGAKTPRRARRVGGRKVRRSARRVVRRVPQVPNPD